MLVSLFYKPKSIDEVAAEFPKQSNFLRVTLMANWMKATFPNYHQNGPRTKEEEENAKVIAQVVNYLFVEKPDLKDLSPDKRREIEDFQGRAPKLAHIVMMKNKEIRKMVVYNLRIRLVLETAKNGLEWKEQGEGKQVWDILQRYGGEFPEEVTDKRFDKYVNRMLRAQSFKMKIEQINNIKRE